MNITPEELDTLYNEQHQSCKAIAQKLETSEATVRRLMDKFDLPRRSYSEAGRLPLDDDEIEQLYTVEGLDSVEIARRLGVSKPTVLRRLWARGVETRDNSTSKQIYPRQDFSGDPLEKAYLQGFRAGDLHIAMNNPGLGCATIVVSCTSTQSTQINLIQEMFGQYGHVHVTQQYKSGQSIQCQVNLSFEFLLAKQDSLPAWIIRCIENNDERPFLAFLAGYTDAEGSFGVWGHNISFRLESYDVNILRQIYTILNEQLNIACPPLYLCRSKGTSFISRTTSKVCTTNKDCWRLGIYRQASLIPLVPTSGTLLEARHKTPRYATAVVRTGRPRRQTTR